MEVFFDILLGIATVAGLALAVFALVAIIVVLIVPPSDTHTSE